MSHQWIDPTSCQSLVVLVETVTAPLLVQHAAPVCMEVDIDTNLGIPADPSQTASLVRTLVTQALTEMPDGGDLIITACETDRGIELEFADNGCDVQERAQNLPLVAAAIGARLEWSNCPQGGGAVTVTFRRGDVARRRAA
tara:strand:- start:27256 stop:27678 length:423 start_codon:yes stop_codon:yes gene_type:complete